jgi:glycosyltransferase involved in cell wall biosynthesis
LLVNLFSPFRPVASGIATYSEDFSAALRVQGVQVNCVNRTFWERFHLHSKGRMNSLPARAMDHLWTVGCSPFYQAPEETPGAINHFQLSGNKFSYLFLRLFDRMRGKRIVTIHERNFATANLRDPHNLVEQFRILSHCDAILVHTEELRRSVGEEMRICGFPVPRIERIPHGIFMDRFRIDPREAKRRLGLQGPVVAQLGFLFECKGIDSLIKVATRMEATILVVGSGPLENRLRTLAESLCPGKVLFRSYLDDESYALHLAASDVVTFPRKLTQGECSGVLVQAMAAGKAIVANDMGCFSEYLADGRGLLVAPGRLAELQAAISSLLEDEASRARYGRAAQAWAAGNLDWEVVAPKFLDLYRGLV